MLKPHRELYEFAVPTVRVFLAASFRQLHDITRESHNSCPTDFTNNKLGVWRETWLVGNRTCISVREAGTRRRLLAGIALAFGRDVRVHHVAHTWMGEGRAGM